MNLSTGANLRTERERRRLTVEEVARRTKLRVDQIRDLEDDDYTAFPGPIYAKGSLRAYGKFLGVDTSAAEIFFGPPPASFEGGVLYRDPIDSGSSQRKNAQTSPANRPPSSRRPTSSRQSTSSRARRNLHRGAGVGVFWALGLILLFGTLLAAKIASDLRRLVPDEERPAEIAAPAGDSTRDEAAAFVPTPAPTPVPSPAAATSGNPVPPAPVETEEIRRADPVNTPAPAGAVSANPVQG